MPAVDAGDAAAVAAQAADFVVAEDLGAAGSGVEGVGEDQPERVDGGVGNEDGADQVGVDGWLDAAGLGGIDRGSVDPGGQAGVDEALLVAEVVFRKRHEETVAGVDAVWGDLLEDAVLGDAFAG